MLWPKHSVFLIIVLVATIYLALNVGSEGGSADLGVQGRSEESGTFPDALVAPISIGGASGVPSFDHDSNAVFHGHGEKVCASGCALSRHPTSRLSFSSFQRLLSECAAAPLDSRNLAYETLLYYGRQSGQHLASLRESPLSDDQMRTLRQELGRQHALVSMRLIDEHERVRAQALAVRVPLDRRHVFSMDPEDLPPLVTSGTVKRVGAHHLWTRL